MGTERSSFRRRVFGGFDRNDVINYIEDLANQRNQYQKDYTQSSEEISKLKASIDTTEKQLSDIREECAMAEEDLAALNKKLTALKLDLQEKNDELQVVKGILDTTKRDLAEQNAKYTADMAAAQETIKQLEIKAEEMRLSTVNDAADIINDLAAKYEKLKNEQNAVTDNFRRELDVLSGNVEAMDAAFSDAAKQLSKMRGFSGTNNA